jgi:hypothetical protein
MAARPQTGPARKSPCERYSFRVCRKAYRQPSPLSSRKKEKSYGNGIPGGAKSWFSFLLAAYCLRSKNPRIGKSQLSRRVDGSPPTKASTARCCSWSNSSRSVTPSASNRQSPTTFIVDLAEALSRAGRAGHPRWASGAACIHVPPQPSGYRRGGNKTSGF